MQTEDGARLADADESLVLWHSRCLVLGHGWRQRSAVFDEAAQCLIRQRRLHATGERHDILDTCVGRLAEVGWEGARRSAHQQHEAAGAAVPVRVGSATGRELGEGHAAEDRGRDERLGRWWKGDVHPVAELRARELRDLGLDEALCLLLLEHLPAPPPHVCHCSIRSKQGSTKERGGRAHRKLSLGNSSSRRSYKSSTAVIRHSLWCGHMMNVATGWLPGPQTRSCVAPLPGMEKPMECGGHRESACARSVSMSASNTIACVRNTP